MRTGVVAGIVSVAVDGGGPGSAPWHRWLDELPEGRGAAPDVRWRPGPAGASQANRLPDGRWELSGPGHNPLLVIQDVLVGRGASLVHGCGLEVGGRGVALVGHTGSGKTVASLAALREPGMRLLSDDLVVVTGDGRLLAFPTPIALRPHHRPLLPGRARPEQLVARLAAAAGRLPGLRAPLRRVRERLAGRGGRTAQAVRRVKTDHAPVSPSRIFPPERLANEARAELVLLLGDTPPEDPVEFVLEVTYANEALDEALRDYAESGIVDKAAHLAAARQVLAQFVGATGRIGADRLPVGGDIVAAQRHLLAAVAAGLDGATSAEG